MDTKTLTNFPSVSNTQWDAALYDNHHSFVSRLGTELLELLGPQSGEHILDLGCGTGHLTYQITASGAEVLGIDSAPAMIEQAHHHYPNLHFAVGDGANLGLTEKFDAVFSNAALHWIQVPEKAIANIWQVLKPGGRLVAEFGGTGNVRQVIAALYDALDTAGYGDHKLRNPWYFPSIGEYSTLLENQGFSVTYGLLFDRPTRLDEGAKGLRNWLRMFAGVFFADIPESQQSQILADIENKLRPTLYQEGSWIVDYKRIRIMAFKPVE